jgi:hypothetical protein
VLLRQIAFIAVDGTGRTAAPEQHLPHQDGLRTRRSASLPQKIAGCMRCTVLLRRIALIAVDGTGRTAAPDQHFPHQDGLRTRRSACLPQKAFT